MFIHIRHILRQVRHTSPSSYNHRRVTVCIWVIFDIVNMLVTRSDKVPPLPTFQHRKPRVHATLELKLAHFSLRSQVCNYYLSLSLITVLSARSINYAVAELYSQLLGLLTCLKMCLRLRSFQNKQANDDFIFYNIFRCYEIFTMQIWYAKS